MQAGVERKLTKIVSTTSVKQSYSSVITLLTLCSPVASMMLILSPLRRRLWGTVVPDALSSISKNSVPSKATSSSCAIKPISTEGELGKNVTSGGLTGEME